MKWLIGLMAVLFLVACDVQPPDVIVIKVMRDRCEAGDLEACDWLEENGYDID